MMFMQTVQHLLWGQLGAACTTPALSSCRSDVSIIAMRHKAAKSTIPRQVRARTGSILGAIDSTSPTVHVQLNVRLNVNAWKSESLEARKAVVKTQDG